MGLEFHAVHGNSNNESSPQLPSRYWHPLLDSLHQSGRHSLVLQAMESMRVVHVSADKHCSLRAIQACLATGHHDQAIRIADDACLSSRGGGGRGGNMPNGAAETVDESSGSDHDLDLYQPILEYFATNDLPMEIIHLMEKMETGIAIDSASWSCIQRMRRFDIVLESIERNNNHAYSYTGRP